MRAADRACDSRAAISKHTPKPVRISFLIVWADYAGKPSPQVLGMPTTLPRKNPGGYRRQSAGVAAERGLLGATLLVALVFSLVTGVLPAELVLPAVSIIVVVSGLLLGAGTLLIGRLRAPLNDGLLHIAGVLVLFGFAAAIVCDKTEALRLLGALPGM